MELKTTCRNRKCKCHNRTILSINERSTLDEKNKFAEMQYLMESTQISIYCNEKVTQGYILYPGVFFENTYNIYEYSDNKIIKKSSSAYFPVAGYDYIFARILYDEESAEAKKDIDAGLPREIWKIVLLYSESLMDLILERPMRGCVFFRRVRYGERTLINF